MQTIDPNKTVGEMVAEAPGRSRVFQRFGIDFCCGGKIPLAEACQKRHVALDDVLAALNDADTNVESTSGEDWTKAPLNDLCDHIVAAHHDFLRQELPRLAAMVNRVAQVHGQKMPSLHELRKVYFAFKAELEMHMHKEEQILFPYISNLERAGGTAGVGGFCGDVRNPIAVMEREHEDAGDALGAMRDLTDGFTPPQWACNTYRAMLSGLADVEADMHQHVHKENNILFPRAIELQLHGRTSSAGGCC